MNNKKPKIIKTSQFCFFGGAGLCLLAVIMIMNFGSIARIFTIGFSYLLGSISYVLYILLFVVGILLLFKEKPLKIQKSLTLFHFPKKQAIYIQIFFEFVLHREHFAKENLH